MLKGLSSLGLLWAKIQNKTKVTQMSQNVLHFSHIKQNTVGIMAD